MYSLKGFVVIDSFQDNSVGNVAPLGELSTHSRTYSREIGKYTDESFPGISMESFSSKYSDIGIIRVESAYVNASLTVANWVYQESIAGRLNDNRNDFLTAFTNQFSSVGEGFSCGPMVTDGSHWMPEYVIWSVRQSVEGITSANEVRLWFSDQAFRNQYDEYEILVVPPVKNLDDLFGNTDSVRPLLEAQNVSSIFNRVEELSGGDPYTFLRTETYTWYDPHNEGSTLPTDWTVVIYGQAGDNVDFIRNALTEYVLENSERDREEWLAILPELFRVTEFIIAPLWTQYSIPNQTLQTGIYRPSGRVKHLTGLAREACVGYPDAHVEDALEYVNVLYKSLGLLIVGGPENIGGVTRFSQHIKDYILVPTTSNDFNRMSPSTQDWIILLHELLKEAESAQEFTSLPPGMSSLKRGNTLYVAARRNNVNYLVTAKSNYEE